MWPFNKSNTNYSQEMRNVMKEYMLKYVKEFPDEAKEAVQIFSDAELMVRHASEKEIVKMLKKTNTSMECGALNIIQNTSLMKIKEKTGSEFILGGLSNNKDVAYNLYTYINNIKYEKGYIDKKQYEENDMLATKKSLRPPLGQW